MIQVRISAINLTKLALPMLNWCNLGDGQAKMCAKRLFCTVRQGIDLFSSLNSWAEI